MKRIFEIDPWQIITHTFQPEDKRLQESITSIGNEYMGMRGIFEEKYSGDTHKGIYLGGVWFPDKTRVGWWKNGYPQYFGKVINAVDFVSLDIKINGESVDLAKDPFTDFELSLDMKHGVLRRSYVVVKGDARVKITSERFVSLVRKELYANRLQIENVGDKPVEIGIVSFIDADVFNEDANYDERFWEVLAKDTHEYGAKLTAKTIRNPFGTPRFTTEMSASCVTELTPDGNWEEEKKVVNAFKGTLAPSEKAYFEKRVIIVTSRDYADRDAMDEAANMLQGTHLSVSFDTLLNEQAEAWQKRGAG